MFYVQLALRSSLDVSDSLDVFESPLFDSSLSDSSLFYSSLSGSSLSNNFNSTGMVSFRLDFSLTSLIAPMVFLSFLLFLLWFLDALVYWHPEQTIRC